MKRAAITCPLVLIISKQEHTAEKALAMMEEGTRRLHNVDIIILPIILNGHFHLIVLDNVTQEYQYYSLCQSLNM